VTGVGWALVWPNEELWAVEPSARELLWSTVFYNGILGILSLVGLIWVLREWRVYGRWRRPQRTLMEAVGVSSALGGSAPPTRVLTH
jgi:hypothetical protein